MNIFDWMPDALIWLCIPKCNSFSELLGLRLISKRFNRTLTSDSYWKTLSEDNYGYLFSLLSKYWSGIHYFGENFAVQIQKAFIPRDRISIQFAKNFIRDEIGRVPFEIRYIYHRKKDFDFKTVIKLVMLDKCSILKEAILFVRRRRTKYLRIGFHRCKDPEGLELRIRTLEQKLQEIVFFTLNV